MDELIGFKFNELEVSKFDAETYSSDLTKKQNGELKIIRKRYICKCSCGKFVSIMKSHILNGKQKTCGLCYTFKDWCIDNKRRDLLDRWDYDLNLKSPTEIPYRARGKYYFKCPQDKHTSENHSQLSNITNSINFNLECISCNSFGQHLLDTYGNLGVWSLVNKEDSFEVYRRSNKKKWFKCLECGEEKFKTPNDYIRQGLCCNCDGGFSYPELFMRSTLRALGVDYIQQLNKSSFKWIGEYRYDFYLPNYNIIIETHGEQHYKEKSPSSNWKTTLEEQQEIDKNKKELANQNNFKYMEIDCRLSTLEWCRDNIMKSDLKGYFDLSVIDWNKVGKDAEKSVIKEVCDYWNIKKEGETTRDLGVLFKICRSTVLKYLKRGSQLGWCDYDAKEEAKIRDENCKCPVKVLKDGTEVGIYGSASKLSRDSTEIYGIKFSLSSILRCVKGKQKQHKGYQFTKV